MLFLLTKILFLVYRHSFLVKLLPLHGLKNLKLETH